MITFFIVAGLMLVLALAFSVLPLIGKRLKFGAVSHRQTNLSIYRDQLRELENDLAQGTLDRLQYEAAKQEVERRVLEEQVEGEVGIDVAEAPKWTLASLVAVFIPLVTISTYLLLGSPAALDYTGSVMQSQGGAHDLSPQRLAQMVETVKERVKSNPDDVEGWMMLAKTTQALGRYPEAVQAFREIVRRVPPDAQLYADFADTLAMANGRTLEGEPQQLIEQALKVDPHNIKALALGGTVAYQAKNYVKAAELWKRILTLVPPDAEFAQQIRGSVFDAEAKAGVTSNNSAAKQEQKKSQGNETASLAGKVVIDSAVAKSVSPGDTVFVFARAATGPKMPLAIIRLTVKDLPYSFELTEAMAMTPGMSISKFPDLVVGARLSKSGNAMPQPGDWESELVPVRVGAKGIALTISKIVR